MPGSNEFGASSLGHPIPRRCRPRRSSSNFSVPPFQGSLEARRFRPLTSPQVRSVTDADDARLATFRDACDADDWDDSALDKAQSLRAAYFDDGSIVSMAGFRHWSDTAGDPCVLTHPDHRGRGYAKSVISNVLAAAIARDFVPLYQTLESNVAAVRIAIELGYTRYAKHVAVRLASSGPSG